MSPEETEKVEKQNALLLDLLRKHLDKTKASHAFGFIESLNQQRRNSELRRQFGIVANESPKDVAPLRRFDSNVSINWGGEEKVLDDASHLFTPLASNAFRDIDWEKIQADIITNIVNRRCERTERDLKDFLTKYVQDNPDAAVVYGQWVLSGQSHYLFVPATRNASGYFILPTSDRTIVSLDLVKFKQMLQNGEI